MGRLTKTNIDGIIRLRKEGYTQKETAVKVGVNVRTVRKYDPSSRARTKKPTDLQARVIVLEALSRVLVQWLYVTWPTFDPGKIMCPQCGAQEMDFRNEGFMCGDCGHRLILPTEICPKCLTIDRADLDKTNVWVCKDCGHRWRPW